MTRFRKFSLVLIVLIILTQVPFAYRRYKLGKLNATIQSINSSRNLVNTDSYFKEYRGVSHVHSFLGGHSTGTFSEIISAANINQLQFVLMTEHTEKDFNTAEMTLRGEHGGVLFVNGNELPLANDDRLLVIPGSGRNEQDVTQTGTLTIVAYPEKFKSWTTASFDGVEVYNVYSNAREVNPLVAFFDVIWSHRSYPDLLFATFYRRPNENLKTWDEILREKRVTAMPGNDAHSNIGLSLNDNTGKTLLGLKLDPYATSFHLVRLHVLLPSQEPLNQATLLDAIRAGHCFIGFDLFADSTGFRFTAGNAEEQKIQGDEVHAGNNTRLRAESPVSARIVILKNGTPISDTTGTTSEVLADEKAVYRTEVYLPQLGKPLGDQPWIISNPIYVR